MNAFLVMSRPAIPDYVSWATASSDPLPVNDGPLSEDCVLVRSGQDSIILHKTDTEDSPLVYVALDAVTEVFSGGGPAALERLFARIDRVARSAARPPLSLPLQWKRYQHNNLLAFFALPRAIDVHSRRWIAEILEDGGVCFWKLTSQSAETQLSHFQPDHTRVSSLKATYGRLLPSRDSMLPAPSSQLATRLQSLVDLTAVGAGSVTKGRTYSMWLPDLTPGQRRVLEHDRPEPLKVRGAAGSGKTLVLELKALRDVLHAQQVSRDLRVLYVTHSWALAQQVDEALYFLDESGYAAKAVDVMPLVALRELIYGALPEGVDLLGEDSLEGKKEQLRLISESIEAIKTTDWSTYRDVASGLRRGVEADSGTSERLRLCFDLMREFIEVMDPNQIKPGVNSLAKYLELKRQPWMVELPTRGSREFVFGVYREYVGRLVEEGQLTTDQALDDFRRYLESYTWNLRREAEGYDLVLVDEFHLFNDTERYILHLLTKDANVFPRLIMAMDPRQSAFALLTGVRDDGGSSQSLPGLELEEAGSIELTATHRFTPSILEFVSYLHNSFPNLVSLGLDWDIDIGPGGRSAALNPAVEVKLFISEDSAVAFALETAMFQNSKCGPEDRVAIIGVGIHDLDCIARHLRSANIRLPITLIESREDVDLLRYTRRNVVITAAEFAGGLQFSNVVVLSTTNVADAGFSSSSGRVTLSQLYLAATRATDRLLLTCVQGHSGVPQFLQGAIENGAAKLVK